MARFILFLILLVPVVMAGNWLLAHPGTVNIGWMGYDVTMHIALLAGLLLVACCIVTTLAVLAWQVATWPDRRRARRRYRTLARGLTQLTHGVTALALGDEKHADTALKKAMALLPDEPLPRLLTAQLLQRQGNVQAARTHLRALLKYASTAMLASKRLIEQHINDGEFDAAMALAEQIHADTPHERWAVITLIDLHARRGDATAMLNLSEGFQWKSPLTREERNHYAALAYTMRARAADNPRAQRTALRHAVGYAPDFLPALIDYATLLCNEGDARQARKWLLTAWLAHPRAMLIDPILHSIGLEPAKAQARLLKPFLRDGEAPAHALLRAAHALVMGDAAAAHGELEQVLALEESKQACLMMAQAEKILHSDAAASRWLTRAAQAPVGECYVCANCGTAHEAWQSHCRGCGAFDTLHCMRPQERLAGEIATV